ncbi:MAG TPA: outer membrane protein transport protein [Vicinamibacterales bacterium]
MARFLRRAFAGAALMSVTLGAADAAAQVDYEIISALQFNFSNPGARSLALAGALTGTGDDATGAWTNPGGLTNISRPEVGVELRHFRFSTLFVNGGRFNGTPTNVGVDTQTSVNLGESEDTTTSLSFVSAVIPRSRFAFAFYRTEVANFETRISTDGVFLDLGDGGLRRIRPLDGELDLKVANYGGAAAMRIYDVVSVGIGLSIYDLSLDSAAVRYGFQDANTIDQIVQPGFLLGPPRRTGDNIVSTEFISADDTRLGVNLGASVSLSPQVRVGASYRQGPKFDIEYSRVLGNGTVQSDGESGFNVPDVIAVGALYRPLPTLNVAIDYRRVFYSQMVEDMRVVIDPNERLEHYVVDDGNEVRGAVEYLFTNLPAPFSVLAVRGGVWFDPDHRIRFEGPFSANTVLYPRGDDEMHYTGGAGVVVRNVQVDVGYDHSERVKTFSASAIYRF